MRNRRLENAAKAAGYAMVNGEDFANEAAPVAQTDEPEPKSSQSTSWSWLNWDYLKLTGNKATA